MKFSRFEFNMPYGNHRNMDHENWIGATEPKLNFSFVDCCYNPDFIETFHLYVL